MELKKTALHQTHLQTGARMVPFAGYEMPVRYGTLSDEHLAVRERAGVFDVSHMGEFIIEGPGALNLISKVSSNNPANLSIGQAQYSCMPNADGGIVDDLLIYRQAEESFMLVVNASNIEKDWAWIKRHNVYRATMRNISDSMSLLAVQGPQALHILQPITSINLSEIAYYTFVTGSLAGVENVIISATGYTGSGGFELYIPNDSVQKVWDAIFTAENAEIVAPVGLGARDTLRLEMGFCLYGNDIDDSTSPLEAGLGWITKFDHDFVNRDGLMKQKEMGISRRLVGFKMEDRGIPRNDYVVLSEDNQAIGRVTSGTQSPCLDIGIGLAYIEKPYDKVDTPIRIQIRQKEMSAVVCKLPFYKG